MYSPIRLSKNLEFHSNYLLDLAWLVSVRTFIRERLSCSSSPLRHNQALQEAAVMLL